MDEADQGLDHLSGVKETLLELREAGSDDPRLAWEFGCVLAAEGAKDEALEWLERGYEEGWRWARWAEMDPVLDPLREEPVFRDLLSRLQRDVEAMRERAREDERAAGLR
jgi:hypothetical protein